jgi:hypothetical protein
MAEKEEAAPEVTANEPEPVAESPLEPMSPEPALEPTLQLPTDEPDVQGAERESLERVVSHSP